MKREGEKVNQAVFDSRQIGLSRETLLGHDLVRKNLKALADSGQDLSLDWIIRAPSSASINEEGQGEKTALSVSGQSQASRHDPGREAEQWLERQKARPDYPAPGEPVILFGCGNPFVVALLLNEHPVILYEPESLLLLAVFRRHDFSSSFSGQSGELTILTPWHLASGEKPQAKNLLVHPPAQRRAAAQLSNLRKLFDSRRRDLSSLTGCKLKLMIVAPISGGSWPVAVSLARSVEGGAHDLRFISWDESFRQMETQARLAARDGSGAPVARLFEECGRKVLGEAALFRPDLVIVLAQAPLDGPTLARLREVTDAPLIFWLVEDVRNFPYVAEVAPAYDVLFHIQQSGLDEILKNWGVDKSEYLPLAADPFLFKPLDRNELFRSYRADLSFMGAGYPNRRRIMSRLAESYWPSSGRPQDSFKIFGSGWNGAEGRLKEHLFEGGRRVSLPECALIYAGGRINLNIHSSFQAQPEFDQASLFVNPRTFEIAAAGAFQIVDRRPLLADLFTAGQELAVADEAEALPDMIDYFLNNYDEAEFIGQAARRRVLAEHTYARRFDSILSFLGWREN